MASSSSSDTALSARALATTFLSARVAALRMESTLRATSAKEGSFEAPSSFFLFRRIAFSAFKISVASSRNTACEFFRFFSDSLKPSLFKRASSSCLSFAASRKDCASLVEYKRKTTAARAPTLTPVSKEEKRLPPTRASRASSPILTASTSVQHFLETAPATATRHLAKQRSHVAGLSRSKAVNFFFFAGGAFSTALRFLGGTASFLFRPSSSSKGSSTGGFVKASASAKMESSSSRVEPS
mmetsp:Transcript_15302/g.51457  ORF Transcript_15302/g.51457 Transcript_15302/m.51457 type:complete len:242 (-) Transcript_15302:534-1259(-)